MDRSQPGWRESLTKIGIWIGGQGNAGFLGGSGRLIIKPHLDASGPGGRDSKSDMSFVHIIGCPRLLEPTTRLDHQPPESTPRQRQNKGGSAR
jgi:hypothetical protein